jgi:uncharacterized protein
MSSRVFLSAKWEYLAMLNYEVDPEILKPHLPPFTEIDYFDGKAIVSVVGFLFNETKVLGIKWPGLTNFEEVNLRFYVKHFDGKKWKRGVAFISEIVPKALIALVANAVYNEHYSVAKMNHTIMHAAEALEISYNWRRRNENWNSLSITAETKLKDIQPGSEEEFIFEHYFGYNMLNNTTTIEYTVEHPRWQVYPVINNSLEADIETLYGKSFVPFISNKQLRTAFLAKGSDVRVRTLKKIR